MARASWVFLATQLCAKCLQSINSSNVHIHSLQWSVSWCLLFGGGHWDREIESLSQCLTVCKRWQNWSSGSSGEVWTLIPQSLHLWFSAQQQERHQTLVRKADSWASCQISWVRSSKVGFRHLCFNRISRTSQVAHWIGIRLSLQGHGFDSWSRKTPYASEQLSSCTTTTETHLPTDCAP